MTRAPAAELRHDSTLSVSLPEETFLKVAPASYLSIGSYSGPLQSSRHELAAEPQLPACTFSSLKSCNGSATVRLDNTAVACGVKAEVLLIQDLAGPADAGDYESPFESESNGDETPALDVLLVPNIELATGCSPAFVPGSASTTEAQALTARLASAFRMTKILSHQDLEIRISSKTSERTKLVGYWTLYIDVIPLLCDNASHLFDVIWAATFAALKDTRLPGVEWDEAADAVKFSSQIVDADTLGLKGRPFACTWNLAAGPSIGAFNNLDVITRENRQGYGHEQVTVLVDGHTSSGEVEFVHVEKNGGLPHGLDRLEDMLRESNDQWMKWDKVLPK